MLNSCSRPGGLPANLQGIWCEGLEPTRLQNGNKAEAYLHDLLTELTAPNLFDLHPPLERIQGIPWVFQIDSNFGAISGIAQLLLQSHLDEIFILPALPDSWKKGKVTGLGAEKGFVLDLEWEEGCFTKGTLYSEAGQKAVIRSKERIRVLEGEKELEYIQDTNGCYVFSTVPKNKYILKKKLF